MLKLKQLDLNAPLKLFVFVTTRIFLLNEDLFTPILHGVFDHRILHDKRLFLPPPTPPPHVTPKPNTMGTPNTASGLLFTKIF